MFEFECLCAVTHFSISVSGLRIWNFQHFVKGFEDHVVPFLEIECMAFVWASSVQSSLLCWHMVMVFQRTSINAASEMSTNSWRMAHAFLVREHYGIVTSPILFEIVCYEPMAPCGAFTFQSHTAISAMKSHSMNENGDCLGSPGAHITCIKVLYSQGTTSTERFQEGIGILQMTGGPARLLLTKVKAVWLFQVDDVTS